MTAERDELALAMRQNFSGWMGPAVSYDVAEAILAAGYSKPRTIRTLEELDALPWRSVIRSDEGAVFEKFTMWHEAGSRDLKYSPTIALPATVLQMGWGEE